MGRCAKITTPKLRHLDRVGNGRKPAKLDIYRWPEVELNHRHTDFQSVALPTELSGLYKDVNIND